MGQTPHRHMLIVSLRTGRARRHFDMSRTKKPRNWNVPWHGACARQGRRVASPSALPVRLGAYCVRASRHSGQPQESYKTTRKLFTRQPTRQLNPHSQNECLRLGNSIAQQCNIFLLSHMHTPVHKRGLSCGLSCELSCSRLVVVLYLSRVVAPEPRTDRTTAQDSAWTQLLSRSAH